MLTLEEIKEKIAELIENLGEKALETIAMPSSGSSRRYFRVKTDKRNLIGAFNLNIEENDAFFSFSKHFHECGLPVPEVLAISSDKDVYIQTDLGDDTLFNHVENCLKNGNFDDDIMLEQGDKIFVPFIPMGDNVTLVYCDGNPIDLCWINICHDRKMCKLCKGQTVLAP